jgi:Tfp pilus assembly protein PilF
MALRLLALALVSWCLLAAAGAVEAASPATAGDLEQLLARAKSAEADGDLERAGQAYRRMVAEFPDDACGWSNYGEFLRFLVHDRAAAKDSFAAALRAPTSTAQQRAFSLRGLGDIANADGDSEAAIALMQRSLAVMPLADTHRGLSVLLLVAHHDVQGAAEQARLAVELAPGDPLTLLVYAILCERSGRHDDGRRAYDSAVAMAGCADPACPHGRVHCCVFYNAACYHAVCGEREQALRMLTAFFAAPNHLHRSRGEIEHDPDFSGLVADAQFVALLDANLPKAQTDRADQAK